MAKIVRSISLDPQTEELAQEKSNFSKWVRQQLLNETIYARKCFFPTNDLGESLDICNGMAKPRCTTCYPVAAPSRSEWLLFRTSIQTPQELRDLIASKHEDLPIRHKINAESSKDEASTPHLRERKYLRRAIKLIWSFI